jgi:diguanylate cyclase
LVLTILNALLGLPTGFFAGWLACQLLAVRAQGSGAILSPTGHSIAAQVIREVHGLTQEVKGSVEAHAEMQKTDERAGKEAIAVAIEGLLQDNERLLGQLVESEAKLTTQGEALQRYMLEARRDALTDLENRRAFDEDLGQRFAEWRRNGTEFCLAMLDVDHFKRINDAHGHPAGDEVLKGLARVLAASVREMDVVGRLGGEEFAVLLPCTSLAEGQGVAERLRRSIEETRFAWKDIVLPVTVSVGLANVRIVSDPAELVNQADRALYAAKKAGRNRAYYHSVAGYDPAPRAMADRATARTAAVLC